MYSMYFEEQYKLVWGRLEKVAESVGVDVKREEDALMALANLTFSDPDVSLADLCDEATQERCNELCGRDQSGDWQRILFSLGMVCLAANEEILISLPSDDGYEWPEGEAFELRRLIDFSCYCGQAASRCADYLLPDLDDKTLENKNPAVEMAKRRHAENYALAGDAVKFWRENIDSTLSASKAANVLLNFVPLSHKKLAEIVSAEKKKLCK